MSIQTVKSDPPTHEMDADEVLPLAGNFVPLLGVGETIASGAVELVHAVTNRAVPSALVGVPILATNVLTQTVSGAALTRGERYKLKWKGTISASKIWVIVLEISVVR